MAKKPTNAATAKAAKQKKALIALAGVLVLALGYAYHTMQGLNGHSPQPVAASVVANTTSTTTTPAAVTTPAATPAADPATPPVLISVTKPAAGTGQLQSFSRFESKDPFAAGGPKAPSGAAASSSSSTGGASTPAAATPTKTVTPAAPPPTSAVIAVNGVAGSVAVNNAFPVSTDPTQNGLFQLVSLTAKTATVSVVGGSYATGAATLTLKVNRAVTLVNTADGKRYTLQLFPQGTPPPPAPTVAATTTPATTP